MRISSLQIEFGSEEAESLVSMGTEYWKEQKERRPSRAGKRSTSGSQTSTDDKIEAIQSMSKHIALTGERFMKALAASSSNLLFGTQPETKMPSTAKTKSKQDKAIKLLPGPQWWSSSAESKTGFVPQVISKQPEVSRSLRNRAIRQSARLNGFEIEKPKSSKAKNQDDEYKPKGKRSRAT